jgi:hypothetical protein
VEYYSQVDEQDSSDVFLASPVPLTQYESMASMATYFPGVRKAWTNLVITHHRTVEEIAFQTSNVI